MQPWVAQNNRNLFSHCSGGWKSKINVWVVGSFWGRTYFMPLSQLLVTNSYSCCPLACICFVSILYHHMAFSLYVFVQIFLLGDQSCWIKTHFNDAILTWLHLQRSYLHIRPYSWVVGIRSSTHLFGGHNSTITDCLHESIRRGPNKIWWHPSWGQMRCWVKSSYVLLMMESQPVICWQAVLI